MKVLHLVIAFLFVFTVSLATVPQDVGAAKSEKKQTTSSKEKGKKTSKSKKSKTSSKSAKSSKSSKSTKSSKTSKKASKKIPTNVNINSADKATLAQLPGVGPATAAAIIKYRKANGKFKSADDLLNVKGIGKKKLAKMKKYLKR